MLGEWYLSSFDGFFLSRHYSSDVRAAIASCWLNVGSRESMTTANPQIQLKKLARSLRNLVFNMFQHGGFQSMGVAPVIIHLQMGFSPTKTIQLLGYPYFRKHPWIPWIPWKNSSCLEPAPQNNYSHLAQHEGPNSNQATSPWNNFWLLIWCKGRMAQG